jgi:deoxyribodipyrimidine photo-lyase
MMQPKPEPAVPFHFLYYVLMPVSRFQRSLVWFRRDLRDFDHAALNAALESSEAVYCVFVVDRDILDPLLAQGLTVDRRVEFILESVQELDAALRSRGGALLQRNGSAREVIPALAAQLQVDAVFANRDYEPAAMERDAAVHAALHEQGRQFKTFKDQVVFEKDELLSQAGKPFAVFTPYRNAWMKKLLPPEALEAGTAAADLPALNAWLTQPRWSALAPAPAQEKPLTLKDIGFAPAGLHALGIKTGMSGASALLEDFLPRMGRYREARDYPAVKGPSYLSVHLRFGTTSVRGLVRMALDAMRSGSGGEGASTWLSELVWRDFYQMILYHHPESVDQPLRPEYQRVRWESGKEADELFAAWCEARTGYPLVDAAMLQLNRTGYMHNRLRMVTASFLSKDLGLDWRLGERYFARQLIDYDQASNVGGWQWAASTGCDAQPWFRIFNPVTQSQKFDAQGKFIRRYLRVLAGLPDKEIHAPWLAAPLVLEAADVTPGANYPLPVVDHEQARKKTLARFEVVKRTD